VSALGHSHPKQPHHNLPAASLACCIWCPSIRRQAGRISVGEEEDDDAISSWFGSNDGRRFASSRPLGLAATTRSPAVCGEGVRRESCVRAEARWDIGGRNILFGPSAKCTQTQGVFEADRSLQYRVGLVHCECECVHESPARTLRVRESIVSHIQDTRMPLCCHCGHMRTIKSVRGASLHCVSLPHRESRRWRSNPLNPFAV